MITDTYEQLKTVLLPLGIYSVSDGSVVSAELKAYATGIELVKEQVQTLLREGFVQTAQDFGIELFEEVLAISPLPTVEERRDEIIDRLSIERGSFRLSDFFGAVTRSGLEGSIAEDFEHQRLTVNFADTLTASFEKLSSVLCAVLPVIPSHLELRSNLDEISWDTRDTKDNSWMYIDKLALTFDSIEQA